MFNLLIRFFICISLTFCPTWSFAQAVPEEQTPDNIRQEQLDVVNNYNKKADSLFEHIFGLRSSTQSYTNHPLDFYSLLGQNIYLLETTGIIKKTRKVIVKHEENISNEEKKKELLGAKPFFYHINPDNILVEVAKLSESTEMVTTNESSNKTANNIEIAEGIINARGDAIVDILPSEKQNSYMGKHHIIQDKNSRYTFQISYQGQTLHTFSNNIQWISFFGPYLVFMEGSQVYENKSNLSFIDLNYFRSAIGRTVLPIFRIPISTDSPEKVDLLLNPSEISVNKDSLTIRGGGTEHIISNVQMNEIAKTQHFIFNVLVSLLSTDRYSRDMLPFFKDIAHYAKELLQQTQKKEPALETTKQNREFSESQKIVEQVTTELLKARVDLGAPSHHTGHYGQVKAAQSRLGDFQLSEVDKEALDNSLKHLETDERFQKALQDLYVQKFGKRKIFERIKGLWAQLSRPQPLGAAKIQSALGLIANSVRPGGTVENRSKVFQEGFYQLLTHKKRMIAVPVLIGMTGFAAPEAAEFYVTTISYVGQTLGEIGTVLTKVKELKSVVDMSQAYNTYIADGKVIPSSIGLASVFGAMFLLIYTLHIPINTMRFVKYLKTQRAYEHQHSADIHRKKFWEHFKAFASETRNTYYKNLAHGEFKKLGMPATFILPDNSNVEMAFQTMERLSSVIEDYKNTEFTIHLKVNINGGEKKLHFISSSEENREQNRFTLKLQSADTSATRFFFLKEGMITDMFEDNLLRSNTSIEIHIENKSGKISSLYTGNFINHSFTRQEKEALQEVLTETKYQKIYDDMVNSVMKQKERTSSQGAVDLTEINLSETEVKNIGQALKIFFLNLSSFANTEYVKVTIWNYWFLIRTFMTYPRALITFSIFPHYFNRVYTQSHTPTPFNNGNQLGLIGLNIDTARRLYPSGREYLSALKQFEAEIIPIERQYLRAVAEYAYLTALKRSINKESQMDNLIASGVQKHTGKLEVLPKEDLIDRANFSLDLENLSKKDAFFINFFQTNLFEESMRDYLKEALGISGDNPIKDKTVLSILKERLKQGIPVVLNEESLDSIRARVRRVASQNNTEQKTQKTMARFYRAFMKKKGVKNNVEMEKKLNPNKSLQMERFHAAKILSKDPEAIARATRSELSKMIIDKPIELFILFALMSGVEYGILKVLYSDSFSENSFFFLSSYLIWTVFMSKFVLDLFAGSWMKLQFDSKQAFQHGFDIFPSKADVEKRFAALKWAWKSWNSKGRMGLNELASNYKFGWRLVISNLRAALITLVVIHYATLGRIDVELLIGAFLVEAVFGQEALRIKMESTYEKFNGYSLKDLIKKDIDIKKFLTHPVVQRILIEESFKYRLKFNVLNSLFVMNIVENFFRLVESSEGLIGSRALYRTTLPGNSLFTEYWNKVTGYAASLPLPTGIVNLCKKVFTSNRFDLSD